MYDTLNRSAWSVPFWKLWNLKVFICFFDAVNIFFLSLLLSFHPLEPTCSRNNFWVPPMTFCPTPTKHFFFSQTPQWAPMWGIFSSLKRLHWYHAERSHYLIRKLIMNFRACLVLILSLVLSGNIVNIPKPHMLMYVCMDLVWWIPFSEPYNNSCLTHGCKDLNCVDTALLTMGAMAGLHF